MEDEAEVPVASTPPAPAAPAARIPLRDLASYLGIGGLAVTWVLLLAESVTGAEREFAIVFDRGWVCGMGTLYLVLLLPLALVLVVGLWIGSGRAELGFMACAGLTAAGHLGSFVGSRPVYSIHFFGYGALLLLVPAAITFWRHRRERGRLLWPIVTLLLAGGVGSAGHLAWAPDLAAVFAEQAERAVRRAQECVAWETRAPELRRGRAAGGTANPTGPHSLPDALAACLPQEQAGERARHWFVVWEVGAEIRGAVRFRHAGREYSRPFRFPAPAVSH